MIAKVSIAAMSLCVLFATSANAQLALPAYDPALSPASIPDAAIAPAVVENGITGTVYQSAYVPPLSSGLPNGVGAMGYIPPYSYYAAPEGLPARPYVGLGAFDGFPFHGQPYGHPFDRWTWSSMTGWPPSSLVRYYYPPVP